MNTKALTAFRFFAALVVVIFHYAGDCSWVNSARGILTAGPQAVTFFYVLSGFVLTLAYGDRPRISWSDFAVARIARIWPLYLFSLLALFLIQPELLGRYSTVYISVHALLMQSWFPPRALALNSPAWAVSGEILFYLVFPIIIVFIRQVKPKPVSVAIASFVYYFLTQAVLGELINGDFYRGFPSVSHDLIYYFPLSHFSSFLIGVTGGYFVLMRPDFFVIDSKIAATLTSIVSITFALLCLQYSLFRGPFWGYWTSVGSSLLSPLFLLIILTNLSESSLIVKFFSLRLFTLLGEISFSFYILQLPLRQAFQRFAPEALQHSTHYFEVYATSLLATAFLFYFVLEKPARLGILSVWSRAHTTTKNDR